MKYLLQKGLDSSIKDAWVSHGGIKHTLKLKNFFLNYRRGKRDTTFAIYTKQELRAIPREMGHRWIIFTTELLKRDANDRIRKEMKEYIQGIVEGYNI